MNTITERLALIIDARTEGAVSNIRKLSLEEQAAAERAELLQAKITDLNTKMARSGGTATQQRQLSKLNGEYKALNSTLASTAGRAGRVEGALSKAGLAGLVPSSTLGAVGRAAPGLLAGAAAFGGFEFIKSGIENFTELATEIRRVAQASSSTVPDASRLVAITHALGLDSGVAAAGIFRLGKNIDQTPEKLAAYNIQVAKTADGNTDLIGTLGNVAEAYQNTADGSRRAGLVYTAFGRAGANMLPILNANREQLEEIAKEAGKQGRIFNAADLQRARDYQIAGREMKTAWQGFAITAAKEVVPALTDTERLLTQIADLGHKVSLGGAFFPSGVKQALSPAYSLYHHFFGGSSGPSSQDAAEKSLTDAANAETAAALTAQVASSFGSAFGALAGPQGIRDAKENLRQASQALTDARAERAKALRDLADVRAGDPAASASAIEAAVARVQAAQERLDTARYTGGSGVASARASLLSAQSSLNRLRKEGGVDTNRLADAEERLRRANQTLTEQQRKAREAQHGLNQSRGLTASQALNRLTKQADDAVQRERDIERLRRRGFDPATTAEIASKLDAELPGTLHRVAQTATRGLANQFNEEFGKRDIATTLAGEILNSTAFHDAGYKAGKAAAAGVGEGLDLLLGKALPLGQARKGSGAASSLDPFLGPPPGITVNGDLVVKGATAHQVAKDVHRKARLRALSNGEPDPLGIGPGGA